MSRQVAALTLLAAFTAAVVLACWGVDRRNDWAATMGGAIAGSLGVNIVRLVA